MRRRAEHGDEIGPRLGCDEHFPRLAQVHRHARLAENVFARLERLNGERAVKMVRCADHNHLYFGRGQEFHGIGRVAGARLRGEASGQGQGGVRGEDDARVLALVERVRALRRYNVTSSACGS